MERSWRGLIIITTTVFALVFQTGILTAQVEETNIVALLQSALNMAIKTFNSQNQPEAILQLNQIIDICQENMASRELNEDEQKILAQAFEYRGRAFYNIGETEKAQSDLEALIKINPRYQLDTTLVSPKIVSLFETIKSTMVGNLAVFSTPSGSEVFINHDFLSLTPMYSTELLKGEYILEVKHRGYDVHSETITILQNTPLEKEVTLTPNTGTCTIFTSPSEVKIYIDDEFMGTSFGQAPPELAEIAEQAGVPLPELSAPLKIEYVTPGVHRLELKKECFAPVVRSISVQIQVHEFEPFVLEPSRTSIQVNSPIKGASVYLDEAFKGMTPLTLTDVCTGNYILSVKKGEHGKWFQEIELKRDEPQIFDSFMRPTITYVGIMNDFERDQNVVNRVDQKIIQIFKESRSINFTAVEPAARKRLEREVATPLFDLTTFSDTLSHFDPKRKEQILADIGNRLDTDLLVFAHLPEEKLQRHVNLEIYSIYHHKPDKLRLAFNDPAATTKFVQNMDFTPPFFQNWVGLITIDTFIQAGITTISVLPDSPAKRAGLQPGDKFTMINNEPLASNRDYRTKLGQLKPGDQFRLKVTTQKGLTKTLALEIVQTPIEFPRNNPNIIYNKVMSKLKQDIVSEKDQSLVNYYRFNLGLCYMHFNNWQKAIEDAFTHASLPARSGISAGTLAYYIALCYERLGYHDEAKRYFLAATQVPGATLESNNGPSVEFLANKKLGEVN